MKTIKRIIGIAAGMAGAQALCFFIAAGGHAYTLAICLGLLVVSMYCFTDETKEERHNG